jgi:hypothetical protein
MTSYAAYALLAGQANLHESTRMHAHALGHPPTYMHGSTYARAQKQICNAYCVSTTKIIRERTSALRYTYTGCLVLSASSRCRPIQESADTRHNKRTGPSPVLILTHSFLKSYFHRTFFYQPASKLTVFLKILRRKVPQSVNNEL